MTGAPVPGHFMVLHRPKLGDRQLLDIFDGGVLVTDKRQEQMQLTAEDLQPATKRSIIVRMLRNLITGARATQDSAAMLRYQELIVALSPESAGDRIGRAAELWADGRRAAFAGVRAVFVAGFRALAPFERKLLDALRESADHVWIELPDDAAG